ncbi:MAG: hypothetical protein H6Q51_858 [Deltaproteobacteria bacterium]|nr:hypothetical protein [Deltaproteobacteria bacterium]
MKGPPAEILAGDKFLTGGSGKVGSDGFLDLAGA